MLKTLMILLAIGAAYYVFFWAVRNDSAKRISDQSGLLRMRIPDANTTADAASRPAASRPASTRWRGRRRARDRNDYSAADGVDVAHGSGEGTARWRRRDHRARGTAARRRRRS